MRGSNTHCLNKEKLAFLASTLLCSGALYSLLSSGPLPLSLAQPATREAGPTPFASIATANARKPIDALVANGERVSPFEPFRPASDKIVGPGKIKDDRFVLPPPAGGEQPGETIKEILPDIASEVDYVGVVVDGQTRALIKPKNGAKPFIVAIGDPIPHYDYRVGSIEPQSIEISDGKRTFTLKDATFEKSGADSNR